jgi:hypothetical protein
MFVEANLVTVRLAQMYFITLDFHDQYLGPSLLQ